MTLVTQALQHFRLQVPSCFKGPAQGLSIQNHQAFPYRLSHVILNPLYCFLIGGTKALYTCM